MKAALLSVALIAAAASMIAAAEPVKVYVFTNEVPSGSVDEQLKARRESLQDLVKILSSPRYQKILSLVKSREGADVIVELVSRGETKTSAASSASRAAGGATASASRSSSVTKQFLKFRISAGQRAENLTTEDQLPWPKMAELAAEDLVEWIGVNVIAARR
jgi:site-specific recombinase XerD